MIDANKVKGGVFVDGWYKNAIKNPSPYFNERPNTEVSVLVIHNISLPAREFGKSYVHDLFLGCLDCTAHESFIDLLGVEVSAHFYISREGTLTQFVSVNDRAWHAGVSMFNGRENVNDFSVGIELEGADDIAYTDEQYAVLTSLTKDIMVSYAITIDCIIGHNEIAPLRKTDPGESFDWGRYKHTLME